jgi:anti-sigma regulatory factor (Ser/Thr protein kinase)
MDDTNTPPEVDNSPVKGSPGRVRPSGADIRTFILENVGQHPKDISSITAAEFGITRQAVHKHLQKLVLEKALLSEGNTRDKSYSLASLFEWRHVYRITPELAEDQAWSRDVAPVLGSLPHNVMDIWHFCFTEMFNNAIDHSAGSEIAVNVVRNAANTLIVLTDNGVGIFKKIQKALNLLDERHAILELAKGKLTTDPERHTGQGIFFSSRMVDSFHILSGGVFFSHQFGREDDGILENPENREGTSVLMRLSNHSSRTDKQIFDEYSSGEDYGFTKTVVPVRLAQYGEDKLISRSQAKRLLARVDRFQSVWFDFDGVESIGQAFADEIFRVFAKSHPEMEFVAIHACPEVQQVINAVRSHWAAETGGI